MQVFLHTREEMLCAVDDLHQGDAPYSKNMTFSSLSPKYALLLKYPLGLPPLRSASHDVPRYDDRAFWLACLLLQAHDTFCLVLE